MKKKKAKKKAIRKKKAVKKVKKKVRKRAVAEKKKKAAAPKKVSTVPKSLPKGASLEEIGVVTHYFPHVEAAVVKLTNDSLAIGDTIIIKGHTSDFKEKVASMQLDRIPITNATVGQEIGLRVKSRVREHDIVYKIIG